MAPGRRGGQLSGIPRTVPGSRGGGAPNHASQSDGHLSAERQDANGQAMILVVEDDGCIHVYPSIDAVVLQVEALDAESTLRTVFDERGQRYSIRWLRPNRETRSFLGLVKRPARREPLDAALRSLI